MKMAEVWGNDSLLGYVSYDGLVWAVTPQEDVTELVGVIDSNWQVRAGEDNAGHIYSDGDIRDEYNRSLGWINSIGQILDQRGKQVGRVDLPTNWIEAIAHIGSPEAPLRLAGAAALMLVLRPRVPATVADEAEAYGGEMAG